MGHLCPTLLLALNQSVLCSRMPFCVCVFLKVVRPQNTEHLLVFFQSSEREAEASLPSDPREVMLCPCPIKCIRVGGYLETVVFI